MKDIKLKKQKKIDHYFGNILNSVIILKKKFNRKKINKKPKKIIIYKLDAIGDSILCLPMIKHLKEKTKAKIIVVCSNVNFQIFQGQKFIDKIYILDTSKLDLKDLINKIKELKSKKAEISIDAGQTANISAIMSHLTSDYSIGFKKRNDTRNKVYDSLINVDFNKHMFFNYMDLLKPLNIKYSKKENLLKLDYSRKDLEKINKFLDKKKKIIGIHPFSYIKAKEWPLERFVEIINFLCEKNYKIVLVGGEKEANDALKLINKIDKQNKKNVTNLIGKLKIKELIALMTKIKLFIANDGGPMHVAAAMNVPVIGLFGYETPKRYAPLTKKSIALYNVKNHNSCDKSFLVEWPKCRNPKHIKNITVKEVKTSIKKLGF